MTNQEFRNRFEYDSTKPIRGGFSDVFIAVDKSLKTSRKVALKFFNKYNEYKYDLKSEIDKAKELNHPNIGRYLEILQISDIDIHGDERITFVAVLEYYDAGCVSDFIQKARIEKDNAIIEKKKSKEDANKEFELTLDKILSDILRGLYYLKTKGIIHRDIKPSNILITYVKRNNVDSAICDVVSSDYASSVFLGKLKLEDGEHLEPLVKIIDFGISKDSESNGITSSRIFGTMPYMAPEQIAENEFAENGKMDYRVDIWSFGVVAYELITGNKLFDGIEAQTDEQKRNRILTEDYTNKLTKLPLKYQELIKSCLQRKVVNRKKDYKFLVASTENPTKLEYTKPYTFTNPSDSNNQGSEPKKEVSNLDKKSSHTNDSIPVIDNTALNKYISSTLLFSLIYLVIIYFAIPLHRYYYYEQGSDYNFANYTYICGLYFLLPQAIFLLRKYNRRISIGYFIYGILTGLIPFISLVIFFANNFNIFGTTDFSTVSNYIYPALLLYCIFYLLLIKKYLFNKLNLKITSLLIFLLLTIRYFLSFTEFTIIRVITFNIYISAILILPIIFSNQDEKSNFTLSRRNWIYVILLPTIMYFSDYYINTLDWQSKESEATESVETPAAATEEPALPTTEDVLEAPPADTNRKY